MAAQAASHCCYGEPPNYMPTDSRVEAHLQQYAVCGHPAGSVVNGHLHCAISRHQTMQRLHFKGQILLHNFDLKQGGVQLACKVTCLLSGTFSCRLGRAGSPTAATDRQAQWVQQALISAACVVKMII